MFGESANDFLSRMTVKLGTTPAQLRNTLLGQEEENNNTYKQPPVFITGESKFIKILKPKVEVDTSPRVIKTLLSTSGSAESQSFLDSTDAMSATVKDKFIAWAADYFALQLGVQEAIEFSAQTIPSDIGVEKALMGVKGKIETSMMQRLVADISIDALKCDPAVLDIFKPQGSAPPGSPQDIMERFLKFAKDSKSGGDK